MKAGIIAVIIAAVVVVAGACGIYAAETSSSSNNSSNKTLAVSSKANNGTVNASTSANTANTANTGSDKADNSSNSATKSVNSSNTKNSQVANAGDTKATTTDSSSNQSTSAKAASNTASSSTSSSVSNATSSQATQSVDWNAINASRVLTQAQQTQFLTDLQNAAQSNMQAGNAAGNDDQVQLDQLAENSYQAYNKIVQNEVSTIKSQLSGQELTNFNNLVSEFNKFNQNSVLTFYPNTQWYSMLPMQQANALEGYTMNMAYFLVYAYGPTSNIKDPQLGQSFGSSYTVFTNQNKTVQKYSSAFANQEINSSSSLNGVNMNNANDAIKAYQNILASWTSQIDDCYSYIKANSGGSINPTNLTQTEMKWITFRNNLVQNAGNGLTGANKQLAELRMNIMMTQLQSYNLITNLSAYVGVHY